MEEIIRVLIQFGSIGIPMTLAVILYHKRKTQNNDIIKLELQKEILELEYKKDDIKIKLLEEENKKLDKLIEGERNGNAN